MLGRRKERERKEGREGGMKEGRRNKKGKQESRRVFLGKPPSPPT